MPEESAVVYLCYTQPHARKQYAALAQRGWMDPDNNLISLYHVIFGVQLDFFFPPNQGPQLFGKHSIPPPTLPLHSQLQNKAKQKTVWHSILLKISQRHSSSIFFFFFFSMDGRWNNDKDSLNTQQTGGQTLELRSFYYHRNSLRTVVPEKRVWKMSCFAVCWRNNTNVSIFNGAWRCSDWTLSKVFTTL